MDRMLKRVEICGFAAAVASVLLMAPAAAQPFAARPTQGPVISDGPSEDSDGGGMDEGAERRGSAPDRDDPSEDGTARQPPAGETPPGCIFQKRSLELLV